ncbi:MAG: RagB/SusD family nutrient uptake outer membrane protein [Pseudobacter sp.]|uniref:RagB/SusD family nutrient uptake outer membrane protein n=1 Tax=Pseudobacter sp. TaxID=2045420 RepID=UPI003F800E70
MQPIIISLYNFITGQYRSITCFGVLFGLLSGLVGGLASCHKIIDIPDPTGSIPQSQVFATDQEAISALSGAYYQLANTHMPTLLNGGMTIYPALSADELKVFDQGNTEARQFNDNQLLATNPAIAANLWATAYQSIYQFNAILENAASSPGLSQPVKDQLKGHAFFGRALVHYYLVSLFEKVPLITSTDWRNTGSQAQATSDQVYTQLITDLQQAVSLLPESYDLLQGGRLIANKYAAMALLARMYAQQDNWSAVAELSDQVISSPLYSLAPTAEAVFSINGPEVILQWQQDPTGWSFNATREGMTLLPIDGIFPFPPFAYLTTSLLQAFEPQDQRQQQWLRHRQINGTTYYYPAKYKIGPSQAMPGAALSEGTVVIRLAEILLLRAEASAMMGNTEASLTDINTIRGRAGLPPLPTSLSQPQTLEALRQERRIELFCEWGHRWLDLKRWVIARTVLETNKGIQVPAHGLVYPIPASELVNNPALQQHTGY